MKKFWAILAVLLALGAAGYWLGLPAYRQWKETRLVAQAVESLNHKDLRNAGLSARQALALNAANPEACRVMAEISEAVRSSEAVNWRQRLVDLQPDSLTNRLELARCGMMHGDYARAFRALQGVPAAQQNNAAFHQLAAMVAISFNNLPAAERHFTEAVRLDPTNELLRLNQAVIHLQATNREIVAGALRSLEQLYADSAYRKDALRHLAMAATRNKDFDKAVVFTRQLQADAPTKFGDRLMHLSALQDGRDADFAAYLSSLKTATATNSEQASTLAGWMLARGMAADAVNWLSGLPEELRRKPPLAVALTDCLAAQGQWTGLQAHLQGAAWEELDFLRRAMLARAFQEQRQDITAQTEWRAAVRLASEQPKQLALLARLANSWAWDKEKEDVLWLLVQRFPGERWALQSLSSAYLAAGNTRGLYRVYSTLVKYDEADPAAKNNLAAVSLLLKLETDRAHELAREAWLKATNNVAFASTYAWSLHLQGRTAEGVKLLEDFPPNRLETPGVALYYGAMLAALNEPAKAGRYLDLAGTGQLLPEEKSLLAGVRLSP